MKQIYSDLPLRSEMNIEGMSFEDLQSYSAIIMQEQVRRLAERQAAMEDQFTKKISRLEKKQDAQAGMYVNALRARSAKEGWVNLTEFGTMFNITLSRNRVAKLLRVVGIAMKKSRRTVAKREYMGDGRLCTTYITMEGHSQMLWNFRRCMTHIDEWMKDNGYFEEFYSKETEEEMQRFIDRLYRIYVLRE